MTKVSLSLILLSFSFLLNLKSFGFISTNFKSNSPFTCLDLKFFDDQVFVYFLESEISEENSIKIIDFITKRKGVNSCTVDRATRKLVITVIPEMPKNDIDGIVHYIEHNFFK